MGSIPLLTSLAPSQTVIIYVTGSTKPSMLALASILRNTILKYLI